MGAQVEARGPDLVTEGVAVSDLAGGAIVVGRVGTEPVLVVRQGDDHYAISATCSHYGAPLVDGIIDSGTIRCPWHHARFDLQTGEAIGPPALSAIACFSLERREGRLHVLGRSNESARGPGGNPCRTLSAASLAPKSVVIVGSGPAGASAAEMLRREGYKGPITMLGAESAAPVDRPNLSKDHLAGNAPEEWLPLRDDAFYKAHRIVLRRGTRALTLDPLSKKIGLDDGATIEFDALLLATGATPLHLSIPGAETALVLRTLDDAKAIVARATKGARALVIGSSFLGLEAAASLTARGVSVTVVGREQLPLARVLGPELGALIRDVHVAKGTVFHLDRTPTAIEAGGVTLDDGTRVEADFVLAAIGVRADTTLAEQAGIAVDRGIMVDEFFRTTAAFVWAAGDVARFPDRRTGERVRIEHWVVAEQQGHAAARSMLGRGEPYSAVPFFWSAHHDVTIAYVGHADTWDRIDIAGDLQARDCALAYRRAGKTLAIATIGRDRDALRAESALESGDEGALRRLVPG